MGLEPISEGPPQHASIGARRAALHHVMLAIEEIRGVAFVKRKRLGIPRRARTGWRSIPSRWPAGRPRRTRFVPCGKRVDRRGIPAREIEISVLRAGRLRSPREVSFAAIARPYAARCHSASVGSRFAGPPSVGGGLGVAHVNRPGKRQRDLLEHRSQMPVRSPAAVSKKQDAKYRCAVFHSQSAAVQKTSILISAGAHEFEKLAVGHLVAIDGERGNAHRVSLVFVVPAEVRCGT